MRVFHVAYNSFTDTAVIYNKAVIKDPNIPQACRYSTL